MTASRLRFWIATVLAFAVWLGALIIGGRDWPTDAGLLRDLHVGGGTTLARNSILFTQLGSAYVLIPLALLAALFLVFRRKRRAALFLIMVFGGRFLVELQKVLVDRPRPGVSPHLVAADTYAFPSGHAANSMITFLAIGLLLPVRQRNRAIAVGIALALSLQVGASRVMLGVHWPTDVAGGWAFGLLWILICMRLASAKPDAESNPGVR